MESLAKLRPLMKDGSVTAGNSSSQNDVRIRMPGGRRRKAGRTGPGAHGLPEGLGIRGSPPGLHGCRARARSQQALFAKTGYGWKDVDLIELNEAFASPGPLSSSTSGRPLETTFTTF